MSDIDCEPGLKPHSVTDPEHCWTCLRASLAEVTAENQNYKTIIRGYEKSARQAVSWDSQNKLAQHDIELHKEIDRLKKECGEHCEGANVEIARLKARAERLAKSLEQAIEMITGEYCSHPTPHGKTNGVCYAQPFYEALDEEPK
jgi:ribosomal protein S20